MKSWFLGNVMRKAKDHRGTVIRTDKQSAEVYASEDEAPGKILRQCPDPWIGLTFDSVATNLRIVPS